MSGRTIEVRVKAGVKTQSIEKLENEVYKIKTPVAPEKGKANKAVVEILAKYLDVPKSAISLISGQTSSIKKFKITA